jgi:glucan-binding YG repeat protein
LGHSDDGSAKQGWILTDSKWYYFDENCAMVTGWKEIDSKWYFFDKTSGEMKTGWIQDGDKLYCCYSSGEMIHDCTMYNYSFDSNGVASPNNN